MLKPQNTILCNNHYYYSLMESAAIFGAVKGCPCPRQARNPSPIRKHPTQILLSRNRVNNKKLSSRTFAVAEASSVISDPTQVEITWQIVVGTLAGVTPFVVAGIEFSKRIVQQRICGECNGSGLILKDNKSYIRCPGCGGFLPWQSWRRFFTG